MSYITHIDHNDTDLLLGQILLSPDTDVEKYIELAFTEMQNRLSKIYAVPFPAFADLSDEDAELLKFIQAHLATGRLYLAQAGANSSSRVHAYGEYLLELGVDQLMAICDGTVHLTSVPITTVGGPGPDAAALTSRAPFVVCPDSESLVDAYQSFIGYNGRATSIATGGQS